MAAGLTIASSAVGDFARFLNEKFRDDVDAAIAGRSRTIDAVVSPVAVSGAFAEQVSLAGPFGPGNPEPVFVVPNVRVDYAKIVGENHLSCVLVSDTGETARAIAFRAAGEALGATITGSRRIHVAGRIKADTWRGGDAGQFQIVDAAEAV
jgi:single-stranded-DNA-specific exonuclease